jgi:hypothetical protein
MRFFVIALLLSGLSLVAACDLDPETEAKLTFENNTDSLICYFRGSTDPNADRCNEVKPHKEQVWRTPCTSAGRDESATTKVVLTLGSGGRPIYDRTARCEEWNDSGGRIVIDYRNNDFVVTDSLAQATPSP